MIKDTMLNEVKTQTPVLQKLSVPEWKKFWIDRGFSTTMKEKGIFTLEPEVLKRIFHIGPFFELVVDYRDFTFEYINGVTQVLGYSTEEFSNGKLYFLVDLLHPQDKAKVLGLGVHYQNFLDFQPREKRLDFKASINLRLRKANGEYIAVLEQVIALAMDVEGRVTHALKYFTDISHLKYSNEVVLSMMDDKNGDQSRFYTYDLEEEKVPQLTELDRSTFSAREMEVLMFVAQGRTSKEIGSLLNISTHTVIKHRQNMLKKTGSKNLNEVVSFAYCNDYL